MGDLVKKVVEMEPGIGAGNRVLPKQVTAAAQDAMDSVGPMGAWNGDENESAEEVAAARLGLDVLAQTAPVQTDGGRPFALSQPPVKAGVSVHLQPGLRKLSVESGDVDVQTIINRVEGRVSVEILF